MFEPFIVATVNVVRLNHKIHTCCGNIVKEGMPLTVRRDNVFVHGQEEEACKVYAINALKDDLHPDIKDLGCHVTRRRL